MKNNLFFDNFGTDLKNPDGYFEFNKTVFDELEEKLNLDKYGYFYKLRHQLYFEYSDLKCTLCNTLFKLNEQGGSGYYLNHMLHLSIPLKFEIEDEIMIGLYDGKFKEVVSNLWKKITPDVWRVKKEISKVHIDNEEFNKFFWVRSNNLDSAKKILNQKFQNFLLHMKNYITESKRRNCNWWEKPFFFTLMKPGNVMVLVNKNQIIFNIYGLEKSLVYMMNNLCHNKNVRNKDDAEENNESFIKKFSTYIKRKYNEYDVKILGDDKIIQLDKDFQKEFKFLTILIDELKSFKNQ
ncbi:hypothetical protein [Candidatus Pelagibacter sp.]|uniref:hypothetical protein n=1 Tax=Candidatus Pelagibacter sp. TaxID=2024849 RepID=UPI003F83F2A3